MTGPIDGPPVGFTEAEAQKMFSYALNELETAGVTLGTADRLTLDRPLCEDCQHKTRAAKKAAVSKVNRSKVEKLSKAPEPAEQEPEGGVQLTLFDEVHKGSG